MSSRHVLSNSNLSFFALRFLIKNVFDLCTLNLQLYLIFDIYFFISFFFFTSLFKLDQVAMATPNLQRSNNISTDQGPGSDSAALTRTGHTVAAVALGCILVLGFLGNFLVLLVFSRFPGLRTPVSLLLINISVSDMLVCLFGTPLSFAASVRGRWLTGPHGCRWYGFCNALFGNLYSNFDMSIIVFFSQSIFFPKFTHLIITCTNLCS